MIIIGLVIGPLFNVIDPTRFSRYSSYVITITLIIVLLDSGLSINIVDMIHTLGKALGFTILVLVFTTFCVGGFLYMIGWELLHALLLGVVSSGTTTIVVTSLVTRLSLPREIQQILIIESIINDITLITAAIVLLQLIQLTVIDTLQMVLFIVQPIFIAIILGIFFAIIWVNVIWWFYKSDELTYVFTIGILFFLYSLTELLNGNGTIAVLILSLSLGNLSAILEILFRRIGIWPSPTAIRNLSKRSQQVVAGIKKTQVDFAFFIKNFFFVYLGIIFDLSKLNLILVMICLGIIAIMFGSRYLSTRIVGLIDPKFKRYSMIISSVVARGFTATFVALLPSTEGIEIPQLTEIILLMVLLSTFACIIGSIIYESRVARAR
jgi:NhaP-type Na+/H+ or K+/H+ antiporter